MPKTEYGARFLSGMPAALTGLLLLALVPGTGAGVTADSEDPRELMKQASMYLHGHGVKADSNKALALYRTVAEQDIAFAQYRLAQLYLDGEHVTRDVDKAFAWLQRAAGLGFVEAQLMLSRLYESGESREPDYVSAYKWLHIAGSLSERDFEERKQALRQKMSFLQLTRARYLARRCIYRGYKNC